MIMPNRLRCFDPIHDTPGRWPTSLCPTCGQYGYIDGIVEPKTAADYFQELHVALVELRTAVIESLPGIVRKALKRWDTERTP